MKSRQQYCFFSSLPIEEVRNIISESINVGLIYGNVKDKKIILYSTAKDGTRNSWLPIFFGSLSENPNGTLIEGCFDIAKTTKVIMAYFRAFAILILFLILLALFFEEQKNILLALPFLISMIIFSLVLEKLAKAKVEKCKPVTIEFIENKLSAGRM
jgi:hypothetical protein